MLEALLKDGCKYHDAESIRLACALEAAAEGKRVLEGQGPAGETLPAWHRLYVAAALSSDAVYAVEIELSCLKVGGAMPSSCCSSCGACWPTL